MERMIKARINATVLGRLLLVWLLFMIRWVFIPLHFLFMVLYSFCELVITSINSFAAYVKKINDELIKKIEQ
jgi:hypothetical protein